MYSVLVPVEMQYVVTSILAMSPRQQLCALLLHALFCTPEQYAPLRITELPGTEYSGMQSGPGLYPPSGHVVQFTGIVEEQPPVQPMLRPVMIVKHTHINRILIYVIVHPEFLKRHNTSTCCSLFTR